MLLFSGNSVSLTTLTSIWFLGGGALKSIFFPSQILIVGSVLHSAPKAEQLGSDSSKTSIVSTLRFLIKSLACCIFIWSYEPLCVFHLNMKHTKLKLIKWTDCLWGHSLPINFGADSALGLAYLPHCTEQDYNWGLWDQFLLMLDSNIVYRKY
jgi:hypothetical protein